MNLKHLIPLLCIPLSGCVGAAVTAVALPVGYAGDIALNCARGGECGDTISGDTGDAYNEGSSGATALCGAYEVAGLGLWDAGFFDQCSWKVFTEKLGEGTEKNNHCTRTSLYERERNAGTWEATKQKHCGEV